MSEPMVTAGVLSEFESFVSAQGDDFSSLAAAVGLDPLLIDDPKNFISLNMAAQLFDLAARRTGNPSFGVHYAMAMKPGGTGLFGQIVLSSRTVSGALASIVEYFGLLMVPIKPDLEQEGDVFTLRLTCPPNFTAPQAHFMDFLMAAAVVAIRRTVDLDWHPPYAGFRHGKPADLRDYVRIFGPDIHFEANRYGIDIDLETAARPLPQQIEGVDESLRELGKLMLKQKQLEQEQDIAQHAAAIIARQLDEHDRFDLASIAGHCKISPRSLQWRLEQAGTSYEQILSQVRQLRAIELLRETELSVSEIAGRLGYSELSPFSRACQTWFQRSPTNQRQWLRDPAAARPEIDER